MNQRFTWKERLHRKGDFETVFRKGKRYSDSGLVLWVYRHPEGTAQGTRLGLAIPRVYGNAVARNRLKRLLREVFRMNKAYLPPGVDMIFSARPSGSPPRYQTIEPIVKKLWTRTNLWK